MVSRIGFLRSGFMLDVLKDARTRPEVRGVDEVGEQWQDVAQHSLEE